MEQRLRHIAASLQCPIVPLSLVTHAPAGCTGAKNQIPSSSATVLAVETSPHSDGHGGANLRGDGINVLDPPRDGDPVQTAAIVQAFKRDGVVCIPGVFSPGECTALRDRVDRLFDAQFPPDGTPSHRRSAAGTSE